jgi:probable HAF family extracellular repeat protein
MFAHRHLSTTLCGILIVANSPLFANHPSFQGLGHLPALPGWTSYSSANAVSADGRVVVGTSVNALGAVAFRWENGIMTGLGQMPGAADSYGLAASADGSVIVGYCGVVQNGLEHPEAFRWEAGEMVRLDDVPGGKFQCSATAVSADGKVAVGFGSDAIGGPAIRWDQYGPLNLGDMPGAGYGAAATGISADGRIIVGGGTANYRKEAFRWSEGAWTGLGFLSPTHAQSDALAISGDGNVIVGYSYSFGEAKSRPFRWRDGTMEDLGVLPADSTYGQALAVAADGSVIVGMTGAGAFIWDETRGLRPLQLVLETDLGLALDGWHLSQATGVSADGLTIVGTGTNPQGLNEAWIARLPDPATFLLVGFGGLIFSLLHKRRS